MTCYAALIVRGRHVETCLLDEGHEGDHLGQGDRWPASPESPRLVGNEIVYPHRSAPPDDGKRDVTAEAYAAFGAWEKDHVAKCEALFDECPHDVTVRTELYALAKPDPAPRKPEAQTEIDELGMDTTARDAFWKWRKDQFDLWGVDPDPRNRASWAAGYEAAKRRTR